MGLSNHLCIFQSEGKALLVQIILHNSAHLFVCGVGPSWSITLYPIQILLLSPLFGSFGPFRWHSCLTDICPSTALPPPSLSLSLFHCCLCHLRSSHLIRGHVCFGHSPSPDPNAPPTTSAERLYGLCRACPLTRPRLGPPPFPIPVPFQKPYLPLGLSSNGKKGRHCPLARVLDVFFLLNSFG